MKIISKFNDNMRSIYLKKYKNEITEIFKNIKETIKNNKELTNIFIKYKNKEKLTKDETDKIREIVFDNFKLLGLGTVFTALFMLPGGLLFIALLVNLSKKMGVNILPSSFVNENKSNELIDIKKLTLNDWVNYQVKVINDCFPNSDIKVLPVSLRTNKTYAATFTYINDNGNIVEPKYVFNPSLKWTEEKLLNVMAHEIIHYYLTSKGHFKHGHNHYFENEMNRINSMNNTYIVTKKDDEFILKDEIANIRDTYLFVFSNNVYNNKKFYWNKDINIYKNYLDILKRNGFDTVDIYSISKGDLVAHGFKNVRRFGIFGVKDTDSFLKKLDLEYIKSDKFKH